MTVALDTSFLSILLNPDFRIPDDPETGQPVVQARERARHAIATLDQARRRVILAAPAVAELLTVIGPEAIGWLELVQNARTIEIAPFDHRAAVELALMNRGVLAQPAPDHGPRQKIKVDRQIVAIAKVNGASELYTDDRGLAACAHLAGIVARPISSLPLPDNARQGRLELEDPDSKAGGLAR